MRWDTSLRTLPQSLTPAIDSLIGHLDDDTPLVRYNAADTYPTSVAAAILYLWELLDSDHPLLQVPATSIICDLAGEIPEEVSLITPELINTIESQFETMIADVSVDEATDEQQTAVPGDTARFDEDSHEVWTTIRLNVAATLVKIAEHDPDAVVDILTEVV